MHELGHSLGLRPTDVDGIDSREGSSDEYRSIMNYIAPIDVVRNRDGAPFDDWAWIETRMATPDTTALVDDRADGRS